MKRDLEKDLTAWAQSSNRTPLVIKGARQVGKSWVVTKFGETFDHFIKINFEKNPSYKTAFEGDVNIPRLIEKLSVYTNTPIIPGKTLLFLDEIQECPEAIATLRYFKEELPKLHVIAAGSLLEFALEKVGMPVGRVEYLHLSPLSFGEFLTANGREDLRSNVLNQSNDPVFDTLLKEHLRTYMWLGGMPEVVSAWLHEKDPILCQRVQSRVLAAYQDDFLKYTKKNQIDHVEKVFNAIPAQLGKKFVFARVDEDLRAAPLKKAVELLSKASIAYPCFYTSAQKPPLLAGANEKFFKTFFLDIGLAQRLLGLDYKAWILQPITVQNVGDITEQFVAQELIAYLSKQSKAQVFYWHRETKSSSAEVDFIISTDSTILPIEVKAGKTGRLKSIQQYLKTHPHAEYGVKISELGYGKEGNLLQVPLYGIEQWLRTI